jgi:hypothetical protein
MYELAASTGALSIALLLLRRRLPPRIDSPVFALIGAYFVIFVGGGLSTILEASRSLAGFDAISDEECVRTVSAVLWLLTCVALGALLVCRSKRDLGQSRKPLLLTTWQAGWIFGAAVLSALCTFIGVGPSALWNTTEYNHIEHKMTLIVGGILLVPTATALGLVAGQVGRSPRFMAVATAFGLWLLVVAAASRRMALLPILFGVGLRLADPESRMKKRVFVATVLASPVLLVAAIQYRHMPTQGIAGIPELVERIETLDPGPEVERIEQNLFMTVRLTVQSRDASRVDPLSYLIFSLNPLPSVLADDRVLDLYASERVRWYEPFNTIGEILSFGLISGCAYFLAIGVVFGYVETRVRRGNGGPGPVLMLGLCMIFIVFSLQYPIRMSTRCIFYCLLIGAASEFYAHLRSDRRQAKKLLSYHSTGAPTIN